MNVCAPGFYAPRTQWDRRMLFSSLLMIHAIDVCLYYFLIYNTLKECKVLLNIVYLKKKLYTLNIHCYIAFIFRERVLNFRFSVMYLFASIVLLLLLKAKICVNTRVQTSHNMFRLVLE